MARSYKAANYRQQALEAEQIARILSLDDEKAEYLTIAARWLERASALEANETAHKDAP